LTLPAGPGCSPIAAAFRPSALLSGSAQVAGSLFGSLCPEPSAAARRAAAAAVAAAWRNDITDRAARPDGLLRLTK